MKNKTERTYGKKKYDWEKLKSEYFQSDVISMADFLKARGIPVSNVISMVGWPQEKKEYQRKMLEKAAEKNFQDDANDIAELRQRQARTARFLQLKGAEKLKKLKESDLSAEDARKMVVSGLQEERRAVGIEGAGANPQNLTQINIGIKTNLDKELESMTYEEVLGLIADLKRLRAGRSITETSDGSAGEAQEGEIL